MLSGTRTRDAIRCTFQEDVIDMYANPSWKQDVLNDDTLTKSDKDHLINNYREPNGTHQKVYLQKC